MAVHCHFSVLLVFQKSTPHATTDMSPAEILFGRKINTKLPDLTIKSPTHNTIRKKDKDRKLEMKMID
jgi:hypothetical protein